MQLNRQWANIVVILIAVALAAACGREGFDFVDSPCQGVSCGSHGECVEVGDTAHCLCHDGYHAEGLNCVGDGSVCDGVDCSGHGRCVIQDGRATCLCDPGYHSVGADCESDGSACEGIDCSGHGTCGVAGDGSVICSCFTGYHNDGPTACIPDPGSGKCGVDADCDDLNVCTDDVCEAQGDCNYLVNSASCDDGDDCSAQDSCSAGSCLSGPTDKDGDSDGYYDANCPGGDDCDDGDPGINPGAEEGPMGDPKCADGEDNDCDGLTDMQEVSCGGCAVNADCDDSNLCTDDRCNPDGSCAHTDNTLTCNDGDLCTHTDECSGGVCAGTPYSCDDSNVCTDDTCSGDSTCTHDFNTRPCDDGDACSTLDVCVGGNCVAGATNKDSDNDTFFDDQCPGGNDCNDGVAGINPRVFEGPQGHPMCSDTIDNDCDGLTDMQEVSCGDCNVDADCDDNDVCNGAETCVIHLCQAGTPLTCDDGNECTNNDCDAAAGCNYPDNSNPCDDSDSCTQGDVCSGGSCAGSPYSCFDGNLCTDDSCNGDGTCSYNNNTDPCNDADACTHTDVCSAGACAGTPYTCSDGNDCTDDVCNGDNTCAYPDNSDPCDDLDPCTHTDVCSGGACAGTPYVCSDGNVCTDDICNGDDTCSYPDNTDPCSDLDPCTHTDVCSGGSCTGTPYTCSDGNDCTDDVCNGDDTCSYPDNANPCDDLDPCTHTDVCGAGACAGTPYTCSDGNLCTDDICNGDDTCSFPNNNDPCDDADDCSTLDVCSGGVCVAGATNKDGDGDTYFDDQCPLGDDCDDGAPLINPGVFEGPEGDPKCSDTIDNDCDTLIDLAEASCGQCNVDPDCDDADICNGLETCVGNMCQSGTPLTCDDSNPCTDNDCDAVTGCDYPNNTSPCDDTNPCTHTDVCSGGSCAGTPYTCDDSEPCTDNVCNGDSTCSYPPNTAPCDDSDLCTHTDTCSGGTCAGTPYSCDDSDDCTDDGCNGTGGCLYVPNSGPCDDGVYCNGADTCDGAGGCTVHAGDPCIAADPCEQCNESAGNCLSPAGTPCDDSDLCTSPDECDGAGSCSGPSVDCGCYSDQCNDSVCNPGTGLCELQPKAIGTACSPDGGIRPRWCWSGICTVWCNNSFETPGDSDHECPADYLCTLFSDTDSAGACEPNSGGTRETGENCSNDNQCRSQYCDGTISPDRCVSGCSSIIDCQNTGPNTSDWSCMHFNFGSGGNASSHGLCNPTTGSGTTGDACSGNGQCRDNYCSGSVCHDLCCTEDDCPSAYVCWFEHTRGEAYIKACIDKGPPRGSDTFGDLCTATDFYDSDCDSGLCYDMGDWEERCSRFCCRDTDCPVGYICEFAVQAGGFKNVRACTLPFSYCCPNAPADQDEADDSGNNAVYWEWPGPVLTAGPGSPEATGVTFSPGMVYTFEGTGRDNGDDGSGSDNVDVDTFRFNTGTAANIHIVLDVAGTGADLDVCITDTSHNDIECPGWVADGSSNSFDMIFEEDFFMNDSGNFTPGTNINVSIGTYTSSTGLPVDWQVTLCAE